MKIDFRPSSTKQFISAFAAGAAAGLALQKTALYISHHYQELFITPYFKGALYLSLAYRGKTASFTGKLTLARVDEHFRLTVPPAPFRKRAWYCLQGLSLCIPLINTVIYLCARFLFPNNSLVINSPTKLRSWLNHIRLSWESDSHRPSSRFLKLILEEGKRLLNQPTPLDHQTAAHHAAHHGFAPSILRHMQELGADFSSPQTKLFKNTPLLSAIANAKNEAALTLINTIPIKLDTPSRNENTALHLAVGKGYTDLSADAQPLTVSNLQLIHALLAKKANPNLQNCHGDTPLHLAYLRRDPAMIQALEQAGACTDIENAAGRTPPACATLSPSQANEILSQTVGAFLPVVE